MAEGNKPFVIRDRRKFTMDGEIRPDAERSEAEEPRSPEPVTAARAPEPLGMPERQETRTVAPTELPETPAPDAMAGPDEVAGDLPPAPTAEQMERSQMAYQQTTDRLDTMLRATNPGGETPRPMNFEQMVNSFYMTAILQLGGATPEGQQPQVDLFGARQSIDILGVVAEKTRGNLAPAELQLLESALFDARMAFLEITQAIARQAAAKQGVTPGVAPGVGPSIVR